MKVREMGDRRGRWGVGRMDEDERDEGREEGGEGWE